MADTKVSALSAATTLAGTEVFPIVQDATSKKSTVNLLGDIFLTKAAPAITSATPTLAFKDTDATAGDDNAVIVVAATDVGDNTEDADVTFRQQVAGVLTTFLVSDADGALTVGQSGQKIVLNGSISGDVTVTDSTPVIKIIDQDAADGDAGVSLTVACTTTTAGAEHVDLTITQQVSGSPANVLVADADGSITLGDGTRGIVLSGAVTSGALTSGDISISDATPVLNFKDSSCAVARVNALIKADASDTGDGTEDIDVTFQQMVAGAATTFLVSDADGSITLGQTNQPIVLNGPVGDITIKDATPVLNFKDSSCAVSDVNAYIEATATAVGDNAENIDVTIYQQVSGTAVACFTSDADGSITLGYTGQPAILSSTTIRGATATLAMKDTDAAAGDVNFDIVIAATDTGDNTEDIDVTMSAQVAGTKVAFLAFDADGRLTLGYNGQPTHAAKLVYGTPVTAVTATATPASTDSGTIYTNEGDDNGAGVTLPAAQASPCLVFTFYVQVAQTLTITAGAGDTIRIGSSATGAGGAISSATVGSSVTLACINATEWVALSSVGSWSF